MLEVPFRYISLLVNWLFGLPFMQYLARRYPKTLHFLKDRFDPADFFGLPFTFILTLATANLALLSELSESIVNSHEMKFIDGLISKVFFNLRVPFLTKTLYYFTHLGNVNGLFLVVGLAGLILLLKRKWYYLLALAISVAGNGISVYLVKNHFDRERPFGIGYYYLASFSFPSGHSASAVALQGILCYFLMLEAKTVKAQLTWLAAGLAYIGIMGFSRIYLGMHFLSDVAAGYSIGFLWLLFGVVCMEYAAYQRKNLPLPENLTDRS